MRVKFLTLIAMAILSIIWQEAAARTYLVAVGICDYSGFPSKIHNLRLPVNDAKAIADLYAKNTNVDYTLLLDKKATSANIKKAIRKVLGQAGEDDIVVFSFSGHGYTGGLCAADGRLKYDDIKKEIASLNCKNKMMFIDACRSGGIREKSGNGFSIPAANDDTNIMLFLASRNNENSIEQIAMKNGFFTTWLIKALRGNADANRDRTITARELFDFVSENVARISNNKQHPVMWGNFSKDMPVMKW